MAQSAVEAALNLYSRDRKKERIAKKEEATTAPDTAPATNIDNILNRGV